MHVSIHASLYYSCHFYGSPSLELFPNHFNSKEYVISVIPTPSHRLSYLSCESACQLLVFPLNQCCKVS